jgi:outer membrane scaffolding protein for murein synthesis (MipA/OmpV family)
MALSRYWHINATLLEKRLLRDAADSPITQKTSQVSGLVGLLYQFQL